METHVLFFLALFLIFLLYHCRGETDSFFIMGKTEDRFSENEMSVVFFQNFGKLAASYKEMFDDTIILQKSMENSEADPLPDCISLFKEFSLPQRIFY